MEIVNFRYAQLQKGKEWKVIFYQTHPVTNQLTRVRIKVNHAGIHKEKFANQLVKELNRKLDTGNWNYFREKEGLGGSLTFAEAVNKYLTHKKLHVRLATLNSYASRLKMFGIWLNAKYPKIKNIDLINSAIVEQYFDYLIEIKKYKNITHKNTLLDLRTFWNFLIKKNCTKTNPFKDVDVMPIHFKRKSLFTPEQLNKLFTYLIKNDPDFYIPCALCYYCLMRRTEITRLKIQDINWKTRILNLAAEDSKNHMERFSVIPDEFYDFLIKRNYDKLPPQYYIVGEGRKPGLKKTSASRLSERFKTIAEHLKFEEDITFYCLKHTGVSNMIGNSFSKAVVRDQAGWKHMEQMNTYLGATKEAIEQLKGFTK